MEEKQENSLSERDKEKSGSSWGTALVIIKKYLLLDWLYP